jgi:hypothetical protein
LSFYEKIQGYNEKSTRVFIENFDGKIARIGNLVLTVSEDSIAIATEFPQEGELWFKGMMIKGHNWNQYFLSYQKDPDWSKGIP